MNFYDLANIANSNSSFNIGEIQIRIEEVIDEGTPANRRWRVQFRYPKSKQAARLGHYTEETMYVFAPSIQEAKKKVVYFVKNKLNPEFSNNKRLPKINYLRDINSKHMNLRGKVVSNWSDLVELMNWITSVPSLRNLTPVDFLSRYFTDDERNIFLAKAKQANFIKTVSKLPSSTQKLIKKLYQQSQQYGFLQPNKAIKTLGVKTPKQQELPFPSDEIPQDNDLPETPSWKYHSVFEPKPGERLPYAGFGTPKSVFDTAARYGIPYKDLKERRDQLYHYDLTTFRDRKKLWKEMWETVKKLSREHPHLIPKPVVDFKKHPLAWNNPDLPDDPPVIWDRIYKYIEPEFLQVFGGESTYDMGPDAIKKNQEEQAYNFYRKGPPKLDHHDMWRQALEDMLEERDKNNYVPF